MFELIKYEIFQDSGIFLLKIHVKNLTDHNIESQIILSDSIFGQCTRKITINFSPKTTHWFSWNLTHNNHPNSEKGLQMQSLWGANLEMYVDNISVQKFSLKYFYTDLNLRQGINNFSPFNKKKFWILGDSHAGYYTNISSEFLTTSNYDIVPCSIMGLSLYRFLRSDWKTWMNHIPILDNDIIAFDIGEIDLRCGLFMTSTKKNLPLDFLITKLLENYFSFLSYIKENFKNNFVLIPPNRPIKDNVLKGNAEYYKLTMSNFEQRINLWENFASNLESFCETNNINYWNTKYMYKDKDGGLSSEVLYDNDIHIKIKEPMLFDLKYKIENLL